MKTSIKKIFFSVSIILLMMIPVVTLAQSIKSYNFLEPDVLLGKKPASIEDFAGLLFTTLLSFTVLASVFMIVYGGVQYIFSEAINKKSEAKRHITDALLGLLLALTAWLILNSINPKLVQGWQMGIQPSTGAAPQK